MTRLVEGGGKMRGKTDSGDGTTGIEGGFVDDELGRSLHGTSNADSEG